MRRLFTETVGIPVMLEDSTAPVGFVKDLVIDQETGRLAAFVLPRGHAISTSEVVEWDDYIVVRDEDSIGELEELVRVSRLVERQHRIFGKKVVTEDGEDLGRVYDMTFDTELMELVQIHVAKFFLLFRREEKLIERKHIIEITDEAVVVKDISKVKEAEVVRLHKEARPVPSAA